MTQLAFPFEPKTNREKAVDWMDRHPHVVALFRRFALQCLERKKKFGINLVREEVRWYCFFEYDDDEAYKFPNTHSPYIARRLLKETPELSEYMECRRCQDEMEGHIRLC